jgi:hypothetical protein
MCMAQPPTYTYMYIIIIMDPISIIIITKFMCVYVGGGVYTPIFGRFGAIWRLLGYFFGKKWGSVWLFFWNGKSSPEL